MVTARRIGADSTDVRQADHNDAVAVLRKSYYCVAPISHPARMGERPEGAGQAQLPYQG
jgi:hypothetical protein